MTEPGKGQDLGRLISAIQTSITAKLQRPHGAAETLSPFVLGATKDAAVFEDRMLTMTLGSVEQT
jgi:hypothetical protein